MTPAILLSLWQELGAAPAGAGGMDRRRLDTAASLDLFACIFWPLGRPGLLIEGDTAQRPADGSIPRCRGVRVIHEIVAGSSGDRTRLIVMLEDQSLLDIFAVLSTDLIEVIRTEPSAAAGLRRCINRLSMWRGLFDRVPAEGLTEEGQRGLFGEIAVLEGYFLPNIYQLDSVRAWVGPTGAPQDFNRDGLAVEVKTTVTKRHSRIMIANEKQLDERPHVALLLAHVRIDETTAAGLSLPAMVNHARQLLSEDQPAAIEFEDRLANSGYLDLHAPLYEEHRWLVSDVRFFKVAGEFPRLTEANLPPGVGDIRYSIIADDLGAHEITSADAAAMLTGVNP